MGDIIIGYDAKRAFRNRTGLGNYSRMIIGEMLRSHPDVWVVLFSPSIEGDYYHYFDGLVKVEVRRPSGLWRYIPWLWRTVGFSRQLAHSHIVLYHGLSNELPLKVPVGMKQVVTIHDLAALQFPRQFNAFDRAVHRFKQRYACQKADVVVAVSEQTRRDVVELLHVPEERTRVVYQSCDPIFWHPATEEAVARVRERYALPSRYVICVGTIEERKNQIAVVQAMRQLPEDIGLVIVGRERGRYAAKVRREIARCGLTERVRLLTAARFEDFPALYAGAMASVYMSRFEGFGIPVLESFCCDVPVVTSSCSSMPEVGGEAALYADPDDVEGIAAHLRRLASDEEFRHSVVERGRQQRQRFTPSAIAGEMYNLYRELLGKGQTIN